MTVEATGARRCWLIWAAAIPLALWALVRVFGLESGGLLSSLMWFTPYAAIAALLVAGVASALRNWAAAVVAAAPPRVSRLPSCRGRSAAKQRLQRAARC